MPWLQDPAQANPVAGSPLATDLPLTTGRFCSQMSEASFGGDPLVSALVEYMERGERLWEEHRSEGFRLLKGVATGLAAAAIVPSTTMYVLDLVTKYQHFISQFMHAEKAMYEIGPLSHSSSWDLRYFWCSLSTCTVSLLNC